MSIVDKVVGGLFGSKSERDIKEIQPYVDKINAETERISGMSNDQLRAESAVLKQKIRDSIGAEQEEIAGLKVQLDDPRMDVRYCLYSLLHQAKQLRQPVPKPMSFLTCSFF